jgi:hypothetical protein
VLLREFQQNLKKNLKVETKVITSQHSTGNNILHTWMLLAVEKSIEEIN